MDYLLHILAKIKCNNSDEVNGGVIIAKFDIYWNCDNAHNTCVRNLQEFIDYAQSNNCGTETTIVLPNVDFSQHSVLINNIVESGCCIFNRDVSIDTINKMVTYSIEYIRCGCEGFVGMDIITVANNMVLVPKIPEDYVVEFKYN